MRRGRKGANLYFYIYFEFENSFNQIDRNSLSIYKMKFFTFFIPIQAQFDYDYTSSTEFSTTSTTMRTSTWTAPWSTTMDEGFEKKFT